MDKLDAMRAFIAVVDTGSFATAARKLRRSPTAVTRGVARLERSLGLELLTRTTRAVRTTQRGAIYAEHCRRVIADLEDSERMVRGEDSAPHGELRIAAPVLFGRLHVMPVVEDLLERHRDLRVRIMLSDRNAHLVREGIDLAVRLGELSDSSLIAIQVARVRKVLVASPSYLDRRGRPRTPDDLQNHDLIAFEGLGATNEWRLGSRHEHVVRTRSRLSVDCAASAVAAAERGAGILRAISYQVQSSVNDGRLEMVLPKVPQEIVPVSIVYPGNRRGAPNVTAFTEAMRRALKAVAGVEVVTAR